MMLFYPALHILIIASQKVFFFFLEVVADVAKLLHDFTGFFFRNGPAGHETHSMPVQIVEGAGLECAEHFEVFRVGDAFGTKGRQVFGWQFRSAQIFLAHLASG